jgi:hypothetical protein
MGIQDENRSLYPDYSCVYILSFFTLVLFSSSECVSSGPFYLGCVPFGWASYGFVFSGCVLPLPRLPGNWRLASLPCLTDSYFTTLWDEEYAQLLFLFASSWWVLAGTQSIVCRGPLRSWCAQTELCDSERQTLEDLGDSLLLTDFCFLSRRQIWGDLALFSGSGVSHWYSSPLRRWTLNIVITTTVALLSNSIIQFHLPQTTKNPRLLYEPSLT